VASSPSCTRTIAPSFAAIYDNAVTDDLWRELEIASPFPVSDIARDFTVQEGVPLIDVISSKCVGDQTALSVRQGRFGLDAKSKQAKEWRVPVTATVVGTNKVARQVVPMQRIERAELLKRYPQIGLDGITFGVLQPTMGALMARRGVQTLVKHFVDQGGTYQQLAIQPPKAGAVLDAITSLSGETVRARQFVFACGPWLPKLFPDVVGTRIVPTRQEIFFFGPDPGDTRFDPPQMPAWVDADEPGIPYGFPSLETRGFKLAIDAHGPRIDPDTNDRIVSAEGLKQIRAYLARRFPGIAKRPLSESRVCQYENSDNGDFIIDKHPRWENVLIVGGGSGHGFKHGPAVGRYVGELATGKLSKPEARFALTAHGYQG
jgi:glycine/D-amino acid oxidase-like deaminating enzyme